MEKQILSAENLPQENQPSHDPNNKQRGLFSQFKKLSIKLKSIASLLTKPKILIILVLIITAAIFLFALISISSKSEKLESGNPTAQNFPSPTPTADEELNKIKEEVDIFNQELKKLDTDFNDLKVPKVNLDIEF